ncbi:MAG TPA: type VI secretion system baseplate subunit TssK [Acetobacteraceae bacterium]|nr:type VI secretion system baseplate subunit TssK [Acetobacteraceae bacterium]
MAWYDKVVWQEGMFLRAQHFQQQDRYLEHLVQARAAPLRPHPWGVTELSLNRDLLAAGKFAVSSCAGVMEDGTPFDIPGHADPPPPLDLPEGARNLIVYLAMPVRQAGSPEIAFTAGPEANAARYALRSFEVFDTHSDSTLASELQVGRPRLRYMMENEERAGFTCVGLTRVTEVQADRRVVVDDRYIAPCLRVGAAPVLNEIIKELVGVMGQRIEELAGRLSQPGARGVAEVTDFLLLQLMNGAHPLLSHWGHAGNVHPEALYASLVGLAGEFATFADPGKKAKQYPPYRHDDLQRSFAPVIADLRQYIAHIGIQSAVAIPLQARGYGYHLGVIMNRELLRSSQFVLVVHADTPSEQVRRMVPRMAKVGASEEIQNLVNTQVDGIALRPLPVAPRQLPFHAGAAYFELDRGSPYWQRMQNSAAFGIHVQEGFQNLRLELWAIRG